MPEFTLSTAATYAAIDLGSNSFRLEVGCIDSGGQHPSQYQRLHCRRAMVSLGQGLDAKGRLSREAMDRGLRTLRKFAADLEFHAPSRVRVVATQTLREARNRDEFLRRAEARLGLPVEVISGDEEARLIYAGVSFLHPSPQRRLVIDIGGRSTEIILGEARTPLVAASFRVGCASISQQFFPEGRMTAAGFGAAQRAVSQELRPTLAPFALADWSQALGASGTARMLAGVLRANEISELGESGTVTPAGLRWLIERCVEAGRVEQLQLPGLKPERLNLLPGGLSVLHTLLTLCDIETLHTAKGALRHGVIVDLHERALAPKPRRREALEQLALA